MSVVFERINSLEEFLEFDDMFAAAESRLDLNFFSQVPTPLTYEDKKQYYRSQVVSAFNRTWPLMTEDESVFFYKGIYNGTLMEFAGGFIEADGITLRGHWYLTAPDDTDSRNPIHTVATAAVRKAFYSNYGITRYKVLTFVGSSMYQWMKLRIRDGSIILVSETETPGLTADTNFVTFHLEV
jgi:hypothetical protein